MLERCGRLAVVTAPLTQADRQAVYSGDLHAFSADSADLFVQALQFALLVMAMLGLAASAVALLRRCSDDSVGPAGTSVGQELVSSQMP